MRDEVRIGNIPEDLLWNATTNNDEKAFRKLFDLLYPVLCLYAKRYIEEQAVREDIVQEVFALLWEDRKKVAIDVSLRSYLTICVRNQCVNHLRREGFMQQYLDTQTLRYPEYGSETNEIYLLTELQDLLEKTLSKLPETYRIVFEMNRLEGKSFEEIAETLHISVRTAKRYKSKTIDILKEDLKDYLPLILSVYPFLFN